jgi:hypothetical protein
MANPHPDFTSILLRRGTITPPQLEQARTWSQQTGVRLPDALVRLGHATPEQILSALAESHGLQVVDLTGVTVPPAILELVPETVALENTILPLALSDGTLLVATSDPSDLDLLQKLQFILNREIRPVLAAREQIIQAINRHYGQAETESVDSMLVEFTDTAIDFSKTEEYNLGDAEEEAAQEVAAPAAPPAVAAAPTRAKHKASSFVERQATVRYYHRMNPERMFPLLVVLSKKAIEEVARRGVSQAQSSRFRAEADAPVEVEPVLPGCHCYPPREQVSVRQETVSVTFWVVPHVLGKVMHARVLLRQEGRVLAEVPLEMCVARQTLTALLGGLSLVIPFAFMLLKHFRLDFESQLDNGFGVYAQATGWALRCLSPELIGGLLLLAAVGAYCWLRPRKRDVFWDVQPAGPEKTATHAGMMLLPRDAETAAGPRVPDPAVEYQSELLTRAEESYQREEYATALRFYESGLALGPAASVIYHHAALAAHQSDATARALAILQEAEAKLGDAEMRGPMWYNMGCFACRLGHFDDAMHYLRRAVQRGYLDAHLYRFDQDLAPLRWRDDFKELLRSLPENLRATAH